MLLRAVIKTTVLFIPPYDGSSLHILFIGAADERSFIELFISIPIFIYTWLWSTRILTYQPIWIRYSTFTLMIVGIVSQVVWNATAPVYKHVVPFLNDQARLFELSNTRLEEMLLNEMFALSVTVMTLPSAVIFMTLLYVGKVFAKHKTDTIEFIEDYQWRTRRLQSFFRSQVNQNVPNVELGRDSQTKEMVYQHHKDRTLNNLIIGSIGTGKTAALITPMLNCDLGHLTYYINNFRRLQEEGTYDEKKAELLNSISVIEPSNDLCQNVERLALAHGIPKEAIYYVNPIDKFSKTVNPLKGPVGKVAEVLTAVIEGVGETQEYFFQQSQRTHLKNFIYLLKLHDTDFNPTLDDLVNMYNDDMLVKEMHLKLKERIKLEKDTTDVTDRDARSRFEILKSLDDWLNRTITPVMQRSGPNMTHAREMEPGSKWYGQLLFEDSKSEHVVGLRNILDDMSKNELLRRVLFGDSDFDFDDHMTTGGVLIVNTAKGDMVQLSDVLGRFFALSLQNAVFRRRPNIEPYHSLYIDEFADYIYESFREFPAQSRKYKNITTVATQTISQLEHKYNRPFMETLLGTMRHKFVYADIPLIDAEYFSKTFGTETVYEEGEMDQVVGPLQEDPKRRIGVSAQKVEKPIMEPSDLIYQKKGQCAYKLVDDNRAQKVRQLDANFLPKEKFNKADVQVDDENAAYWITYRREHGLNDLSEIMLDEVIVEDIPDDTQDDQNGESGHYPKPADNILRVVKDHQRDQPSNVNERRLKEEAERVYKEEAAVTSEASASVPSRVRRRESLRKTEEDAIVLAHRDSGPPPLSEESGIIDLTGGKNPVLEKDEHLMANAHAASNNRVVEDEREERDIRYPSLPPDEIIDEADALAFIPPTQRNAPQRESQSQVKAAPIKDKQTSPLKQDALDMFDELTEVVESIDESPTTKKE